MIIVDISSGLPFTEREGEGERGRGRERQGGRGTGVDPCRVDVRRTGKRRKVGGFGKGRFEKVYTACRVV